MPNLETQYLGLALRNPVVVASSGLTKSVDRIKECAEAGAGAVVIKSLFEEAIAQEDWGLGDSRAFHTEVYDYLRADLQRQYGPKEYRTMIEKAKKAVDIPVIASINCVSDKYWPSYAVEIEAAGADALELNVFTTANDPETTSEEMERLYVEIIQNVRSKTKLPIAIKMGRYFSALPRLARTVCDQGAHGIVIFNRFTEPDIDIEKLKLTTTFHFSNERDLNTTLRWVAILAGTIGGDLAATTGIHTGAGLIKMLLAGATVTQVASVLYKKGLGHIPTLLEELESWMTEHQFESIEDFHAKLSFQNAGQPDHYLRAQFIEKIKGVE